MSGAAARLLAAAAAGSAARPAEARRGRVEHEVVAAADGADLLVCARRRPRRLGPRSLGKRALRRRPRAVPVLLVWPDEPPLVRSSAASAAAPARAAGPLAVHREARVRVDLAQARVEAGVELEAGVDGT